MSKILAKEKEMHLIGTKLVDIVKTPISETYVFESETEIFYVNRKAIEAITSSREAQALGDQADNPLCLALIGGGVCLEVIATPEQLECLEDNTIVKSKL